MRLVSWLLGVAAFFLHAPSKESVKVSVTLWPPGPSVYPGESVLLRCSLDANASSAWSYTWFGPHTTPNPRHLVSGDSYFITAVTREDAGSYRCQATWQEDNTTTVILVSQSVALSVAGGPPPSLLTLTPGSSQVFGGERFSVRCPESHANSSVWTLRRFPPGRHDDCSSLGGVDKSGACWFTAGSGNGGLYWCEDSEGGSNAINITVSWNVTSADETAASSSAWWTWILASCVLVPLVLLPVTVWLVLHFRSRTFMFSKADPQRAELPATKQDVTEVQWDMSWMEMTNLLDK